MEIGNILKNCRSDLNWTQEQVAKALKVQRELVAMWETGSRTPGLKALEKLAMLYRVDLDYLLGKTNVKTLNSHKELLYRGIKSDEPQVHIEIENWLRFLDNWAQIVIDNDNYKKPRFPKALDKGPNFVDSRHIPTLVTEVRDNLQLGHFDISCLEAVLDELKIIVYKSFFNNESSSIFGAFYEHPKLGYSIFINAQTSPGRQAFTLAHEMCHALYHYGTVTGSVNRKGNNTKEEFFANKFAAHFLVPSRELKEFIESIGWENNLDPDKVIILSYLFNVSFQLMLIRLEQEAFIKNESRQEWEKLQPNSMAKSLNLPSDLWQIPKITDMGLNKYPSSVLKKTKELIESDIITESQAANLLDVDLMTIRLDLMAQPQTSEAEHANEFEDLTCAR